MPHARHVQGNDEARIMGQMVYAVARAVSDYGRTLIHSRATGTDLANWRNGHLYGDHDALDGQAVSKVFKPMGQMRELIPLSGQ